MLPRNPLWVDQRQQAGLRGDVKLGMQNFPGRVGGIDLEPDRRRLRESQVSKEQYSTDASKTVVWTAGDGFHGCG